MVILSALCVVTLVTALTGSASAAPPPAAGSPSGGAQEIVVGLAPGTSPSASVRAASSTGRSPVGLPANRYLLHVPAAQVATTLATLRAQSDVSYAEVPKPIHAAVTPDDPCYVSGCGPTSPSVLQPYEYADGSSDPNPAHIFANQDNLAAVNAQGAWASTHGSANVRVAVLDGPVEVGNPMDAVPTNPDLSGKVEVGDNVCLDSGDAGCYPASAVDPTGGDDVNLGHGTHVTGIVGAATNNGQGVASLGWNTQVETYQVLDNTGGGSTTDLATAIYEAVAGGARVINMSLAGSSCSVDPAGCGPDADTYAAVEYAEAHNVVLVAAAGNNGTSEGLYPASYPGVLSVAATDDSATVEPFSENGSAANIAAPGYQVLSTWDNGGYATLDGTSMASPAVAAAAALVIAANPALSGQQVAAILKGTAGPTSGPSISGGMLDAAAAVRAAMAGPVPPPQGYELAGADGSTYPFGAALDVGGVSNLVKPVVGAAGTPDRQGEWLASSDGGVFALGDARFEGSEGNQRLNRPIVGMAATPDGGGYWLVASDGGVFTFGDAHFYGSTGNERLNKPVVGMAATGSGGYWLVASDGGIFTFGPGANFEGSEGNKALNKPIVGMAATGFGGYWLVASDGGVFTFGPGATFYGSTGGQSLPGPIVALTLP